MSIRVKICGLTSLEDAQCAVDSGADFLGFIFYPASPRAVTVPKVAEIVQNLKNSTAKTVGVFVDSPVHFVNEAAAEIGLDFIQLHGSEDSNYIEQIEKPVIKVFRINDYFDLNELKGYNVPYFLLDTYKKGLMGGTGKTFNWDKAVEAKGYGEIFLSGGLTVGNVEEAVKKVNPFCVDISSGVESSPGIKDKDKIKEIITKVKSL